MFRSKLTKNHKRNVVSKASNSCGSGCVGTNRKSLGQVKKRVRRSGLKDWQKGKSLIRYMPGEYKPDNENQEINDTKKLRFDGEKRENPERNSCRVVTA